ncbi:MAG TPA: S16 family serine protease [Verrucomicrobiales bacterium]|nr:S16 family serine protease [Verrucomicrobiales bacterium]
MKPAPLLIAALFVATPGLLLAQSKESPKTPPAPATAPAVTAGPQLKSRQSTVFGLLVMQLGEGKLAGQASQMNATAVQGGTAPGALKFNQDVGKDMEGALNEVKKFISVRHNGWPEGWTIELSFEDHYQPKDGPSAAVACALMVDSLLTGVPLHDKTAITGDLNANGSVQPVGGVPDKMRAAAKRQCSVACIPVKNGRSMADHTLLQGPAPLFAIQIFTAEKFEDAKKVAATPRDPAVEKAITDFAEIARVLTANRDPANAIRHPKVIERLKTVLKSAPNHLSAKLLLEFAEGKNSKVLSPAGSLEAINSESEALLAGIRSGKPEKLEKDKIADSISHLNTLRPRLDKRTTAYVDAIMDFGKAFRYYKADAPDTRFEAVKALQELNAKASRVSAEWERLRADKALMETVMDQ